jgi:hypothetical protein
VAETRRATLAEGEGILTVLALSSISMNEEETHARPVRERWAQRRASDPACLLARKLLRGSSAGRRQVNDFLADCDAARRVFRGAHHLYCRWSDLDQLASGRFLSGGKWGSVVGACLAGPTRSHDRDGGGKLQLVIGNRIALVDPHLASHARFSVGTVLYCDDLDFKAEIFLAAVGRFEG